MVIDLDYKISLNEKQKEYFQRLSINSDNLDQHLVFHIVDHGFKIDPQTLKINSKGGAMLKNFKYDSALIKDFASKLDSAL
jgi:hypothetical protein